MKKVLSVILSLTMLLGIVMPMGVAAEEALELTQAERFELINNPYTSFDLNLFEDFFATDEDFAAAGWDQSSTAESSNILAYKGFAYSNYSNRYPMDTSYVGTTTANVTAFKTEEIEGSTGITPEADGSYTYTIGSVPFELGTIAETGKMGANGFLIRARYQPSLYSDSDNPINAVPNNYLTTEGKAVSATSTIGQAVYTLNQTGLKSAELLMTALWNSQTTYHTVYVTYEGESEPVKYFAVSGYGTKDLKDNIFLVPKNTYDNLTGDITMKLPTDYTLDEFKALVGDDSLTELPSNWKNYQTAYNSYLETTKYYQLNGDNKDYQNSSTENNAGVIKLNSKETAVDLSKLSANCTTSKVLLPTETQKFVPARRYSATKKSDTPYNTTYTYKISVPLDPNKKVSTIKIAGEMRSPVDFVEESGGVSKVAKDSTVYYGKLMLKYEGNNVYTDSEGNQHYIFLDISRECGTGAILGMTLVNNDTLYDRYLELNEELKSVNSLTAKAEDCSAYRADVAELIAEADGNLIESDFDLSKIIAAEERLEEEIEAARQEAARQEAMTKRTYNYLTLSANRDVFVTWKDITDLARFQYDAAGTSKTVPEGYNTEKYTVSETEEIFNWIPHVRADGTTKVTGKEYYYYKGFTNVALTELSENEDERGAAPAAATFAYLLDDITGKDGASVTGRKVAGISSGSNYGSDEYYKGSDGVARATTDTKKTVKNPEFAQTLDENGYFIIKKDAESETHYKIGPVVQNGYSPNAQITGSSINNVNVKGTTLDLLMTAANINYNTTYYKTANNAIGAVPVAALQQVTVTYEDGETDTKYVVLTNNTTASYNGMYAENPVLRTIVFAPKYGEDGVTEIVYDENSFYANKADYDFKILKGNTATVGLTDAVLADDVSFENPDIIMASYTKVAQMIQLRQDAMTNSSGAFSSAVSLPLANKKVESISFPVTQNIAINDPSAIVVLDGAKDISKSTVALLPVEIKGASDDYVYFAYLGRITSETYLMSATVTENSSNEKIVSAQDAMSKITEDSTIEEAKKAAELYSIALEDANVKESDFNSEVVTAFNSAYQTIRENINLSGKITVNYYKGENPTAEVEIYNLAELAGKPYKVILAYYDESGNYISSKVQSGETTTVENISFTITDEKYPKNATKVKGFIWKGFDTLIPLATADETVKKDTFKVLSIGNSYSNNAHSHLVKIAADAGFEKVEIANLFEGGCTLQQHYDYAQANSTSYTYQYQELNADGTVKSVNTAETTMLDGIKANDWDVITIQQQSLNSGVEATYVKEQIDYLVDYINTNKTNKNARVVWHMTWPYATDYTENTLYGTYFDYNQNSMYNGIVDAVKTHIVTRDDFDYIIPAGTAIQNARLLELDDAELSSDGTHLNSIGCYVAGLTWFAKITGMSIDDITYAPNDTVKDNLDLIKTAVKNAIANPYQVTK